MKNIIVFTLISLLSLNICFSQERTIKIKGTITGYSDNTMVVLNNIETQTAIDTTYIKNNQFSFTALKSEPIPLAILIKNLNKQEYLFIWLEDVDITINGEKDNINYASVEGGELQNQSNIYRKLTHLLDKRFDSLNIEAQKAFEAKEMKEVSSLKKQLDKTIKDRITVGTIYIRNNPDNLFSALTLQSCISGLDKSEIKSLYENLSPKIKESNYAESIRQFLQLSKDISIGDVAYDFELPDLNGNKIGLKDFNGKYILLEFWSAGCKPCRTENKNLLKNYLKYKNKGFEIISIISDRNKNYWQSATKKDSIIWASLQDFKSEVGRVSSKYNVKIIPSNFLINPNGVIIEINLKGEELNEKLKEIFIK